jgi:hypothetical protein
MYTVHSQCPTCFVTNIYQLPPPSAIGYLLICGYCNRHYTACAVSPRFSTPSMPPRYPLAPLAPPPSVPPSPPDTVLCKQCQQFVPREHGHGLLKHLKTFHRLTHNQAIAAVFAMKF